MNEKVYVVEEETTKETKRSKVVTWAKDHAAGIAYGVIYGGITLGTAYMGIKLYKDNKKMKALWDNAMKAFKAGDKGYDYGPYKVASFAEPFGEELGKILMHEDSVKAFLDFDK